MPSYQAVEARTHIVFGRVERATERVVGEIDAAG